MDFFKFSVSFCLVFIFAPPYFGIHKRGLWNGSGRFTQKHLDDLPAVTLGHKYKSSRNLLFSLWQDNDGYLIFF